MDEPHLSRRVELLTGASAFTLHAEPGLQLHAIRMSDGPTGVRGAEAGHLAALLPNATLLASTWDEELLEDVGATLAEEAMAQHVHVVLGPTVNLHRSPLGGRLFEAFSEDPLLTGRLAAAYVRGLQGAGVAACLKHLVANESETDRTSVSSDVDEATLREVYLLPFEIAIDDAHPWSIMAAYNDVNGIPATENAFLLTQILRNEWNWDGVVMSDWGAARTAVPSAAAGLDLVMPGPTGPWGHALLDAVRSGELSEHVVNTHVDRLLLLAKRVGAWGDARVWPTGLPTPERRRGQLTRLAAAGITVLTNDGVLPLVPDEHVALIGRHAIETVAMGGGSAEVHAPYEVTIAEGLMDILPGLVVCDGGNVRARLTRARAGSLRGPSHASAPTLLLRGADGEVLDSRMMVSAMEMLGGDFAEVELEAIVNLDGPCEVGVLGVGDWQLDVDGVVHRCSLRVAGRGLGEEAVAPPSWASPVQAQRGSRIRAIASIGPAFHGRSPFGSWGLAVRPVPLPDDLLIARAVEAAKESTVSVVVVGLTEEQETETVDKSTLALPGRQDELVHRVAAAAPRTVVVVNAATPVLMPWKDEVAAILWAGLPGQEGGHAVASVLTGALEPSGRLVTTFPAADGCHPAWSVTPTDGHLTYDEGAFVGHRGNAAGLAPEPAFWMGHGLGYADWRYDEAQLVGLDRLQVIVTNVGQRPSREVVQVYLQPTDTTMPVRLVGWGNALVEPGETATVTVELDRRVLRHWVGSWQPIESGELLVARGLGDVRHRLAWSSPTR